MQAPFADPFSGLELIAKSLPLVGRDAELRLLCLLLDTIALNRQAGARAVTISAEVGVGKSRLLAEMSVEARSRGFHVLEGRAYEASAMFPYLPFMQALRPILLSASSQQLRRYVGLEDEYLAPYSSNPISLYSSPLVTALSSLFPELPGMV